MMGISGECLKKHAPFFFFGILGMMKSRCRRIAAGVPGRHDSEKNRQGCRIFLKQ